MAILTEEMTTGKQPVKVFNKKTVVGNFLRVRLLLKRYIKATRAA